MAVILPVPVGVFQFEILLTDRVTDVLMRPVKLVRPSAKEDKGQGVVNPQDRESCAVSYNGFIVFIKTIFKPGDN